MSNRISSNRRQKAEEAKTLFRCPSRAAVPTELIPNVMPKSWSPTHGKIDRRYRVARPKRPNRAELPGVGCGGGGVGTGHHIQVLLFKNRKPENLASSANQYIVPLI